MASRVRVFIATSLDGFIAGENDDLSWLPPPVPGDDAGFGAFLTGVGALLMGRRTYQVVAGFDGEWPYGQRPVLVATRRPLQARQPTVRAVTGGIAALVDQARAAAGGLDVYLDGGDVIRQAIDAGLIDELTVTVVPAILGRGAPLFAGAQHRQALTLRSATALANGLVQLVYTPARATS